MAAPKHLQPIRNYLRFLGPARPADVAGFLETSVKEVKAHWPEDAVPVKVAGAERWWLGGEAPKPDAGLVRLLGGFDLLLQGRDRDLLVPDTSRHKALWPALGRPGAVLVGTDIVGTWRPKTSGKRFTLRLRALGQGPRSGPRSVGAPQAERLAARRGRPESCPPHREA